MPSDARLRGHLTPCLLHRHGAEHSFSFGPSPSVPAFLAQPPATTTSADFSLRLNTVALSDLPR